MNKQTVIPLLTLVAGLAIPAFSGCSTVVTTKPLDLNDPPRGVRIYPPKVYFLVDQGKSRTQIVVLPDYTRAYDVKPRTVLAKQDFKVELDEGQLKALTANQDTTAILSFIKDAATLAAKATGTPVSAQTFEGTFGLATGVYILQDNGTLTKQ